jgi:hypothetical protein
VCITRPVFKDYKPYSKKGESSHEKNRSQRQGEIRKEGGKNLDGSHVHADQDQVGARTRANDAQTYDKGGCAMKKTKEKKEIKDFKKPEADILECLLNGEVP